MTREPTSCGFQNCDASLACEDISASIRTFVKDFISVVSDGSIPTLVLAPFSCSAANVEFDAEKGIQCMGKDEKMMFLTLMKS